jgi:hypothetical protein
MVARTKTLARGRAAERRTEGGERRGGAGVLIACGASGLGVGGRAWYSGVVMARGVREARGGPWDREG